MKNVPRSIKDKYEVLSVIGEGAYGVVLKARKRDSNTCVAIKYFKQTPGYNSDLDIIERELKILQSLRFENVVELLEWFHDRKRCFLIFEYVEWNMLQVLQEHPEGLPLEQVRRLSYQLFSAIHWCHMHDIIHRDIKPENLLISKNLVLKLCDFGFARFCNKKVSADQYTGYVATRWYRAPELLIGLPYGKPVDIWACGCIMGELKTGQALFAGESDIDQLYRIQKGLGPLPPKYMSLMKTNSRFQNIKFPPIHHLDTLEYRFAHLFPSDMMNLFQNTLRLYATDRLAAGKCVQHESFLYLNEKPYKSQSSYPPKTTTTPTTSSQSEVSHTNRFVHFASPYNNNRLSKSCDDNGEIKKQRRTSTININYRSVDSLTDIPYGTTSPNNQQVKYHSNTQLSDRSSQCHQPKIIGTHSRMQSSYSDDQLNQPYTFTPRGSNVIHGDTEGDIDPNSISARKKSLRNYQVIQSVPQQETSREPAATPSPRLTHASNGILLRPKQPHPRNILQVSPKDVDKKIKRYSLDQYQTASNNQKLTPESYIYRSSVAFTPIQKRNLYAIQINNNQNGFLVHQQIREESSQNFFEKQPATREINRDLTRSRTVDYATPGETTPLPQRASSRQSQLHLASSTVDQTDNESKVSKTSKSSRNFEQPLYYKYHWSPESRKPIYASDSYLMNLNERNSLFSRPCYSPGKADCIPVNKVNIPPERDQRNDSTKTTRLSSKQNGSHYPKTPLDSNRKQQSSTNSFAFPPSARSAVAHLTNCVMTPAYQGQQSNRFSHTKPRHNDS